MGDAGIADEWAKTATADDWRETDEEYERLRVEALEEELAIGEALSRTE